MLSVSSRVVIVASSITASLAILWITCSRSRRRRRRQLLLSMPKVELNAHLHGSIRPSTLFELGVKEIKVKTLENLFSLFDKIHRLVKNSLLLRRIIREVLDDFQNDNVCLLELRTTPRILDDVPTRKDYVECVQEELERFKFHNAQSSNSMDRQMRVGLVLGIDRAEPIQVAEEVVSLAIELKNTGVVGVDLNGDPSKGDLQAFIPLLKKCRSHGLKVTAHVGEVFGSDDEFATLLAFEPDRVGHALCQSFRLSEDIISKKIPVEVSPTSNSMILQLKNLKQHPSIDLWRNSHHAFALCTDDAGIFNTSLSNELACYMASFNESLEHVVHLQLKTVEMSFLDEFSKETAREAILEWSSKNKIEIL